MEAQCDSSIQKSVVVIEGLLKEEARIKEVKEFYLCRLGSTALQK